MSNTAAKNEKNMYNNMKFIFNAFNTIKGYLLSASEVVRPL